MPPACGFADRHDDLRIPMFTDNRSGDKVHAAKASRGFSRCSPNRSWKMQHTHSTRSLAFLKYFERSRAALIELLDE